MDFLTTAEYAKIWNISQRRVAIYCKEGRIEGAVLKGKTWLIPENTKKPEDPRRVQKMDSNFDKIAHRNTRKISEETKSGYYIYEID